MPMTKGGISMAEKTGAELKEYLKRAADLESMLYAYKQTKDLLQ